MMFKGTASRSALDIAIQSDLFGGQLNAYTSKEYTCYYAHTLSDHAPTAFEMLCDMLTGPRMDKEDVELERGVILDEIAMYEDSAEDVAADLLYDGVWAGHSLGRPFWVRPIRSLPLPPRIFAVIWTDTIPPIDLGFGVRLL